MTTIIYQYDIEQRFSKCVPQNPCGSVENFKGSEKIKCPLYIFFIIDKITVRLGSAIFEKKNGFRDKNKFGKH